MTSAVRIVEVGPRDGLQNEAKAISPEVRARFIALLIDAGLKAIEAGSFVSPKWIPQMAGTREVLALVGHPPGVDLQVLVPNMVGLEAAVTAGAREVAIFASASEAFSHKNINCSIDESLERFRPVAAEAARSNIRLRGYVSCVMGCPYQGDVPLDDVVRVSRALSGLGCYEISLGDTVGTGNPRLTRAMIDAVKDAVPAERLAAHFHDTYGLALANVLAAVEAGVRSVDVAAGGLGGCPYAKGASGNLATEALVRMLDGMGIETGVDMERLLDAVDFIATEIGRKPRSSVWLATRGAEPPAG